MSRHRLVEHGAPIQWQRPRCGRSEYLVLQGLSSEVLEILRKAGGDLRVADEDGPTLLDGRGFHRDCTLSDINYLLALEALERLIQRGANFRTGSTSTVAIACCLEFWDIAVRLIELGADPNGTDYNGYSPLDHAVGAPVQVKRLFELGADPNSSGPSCFRPIHYACRAGDLESLRLLLAAGADPDCKTSEGKSAVQLVKESERKNAPLLLELLAQAKRLPERKSGPVELPYLRLSGPLLSLTEAKRPRASVRKLS